jgi:hypothetical protein
VQLHHLAFRRVTRASGVAGDQRAFSSAGDIVVGGVTVGIDL